MHNSIHPNHKNDKNLLAIHGRNTIEVDQLKNDRKLVNIWKKKKEGKFH